MKQTSISYQGPESFKQLIESAYNPIRNIFPREGTPQVIVGGIGRIHTNIFGVTVEGDAETNAKIDEKYRACKLQREQGGSFTDQPTFRYLNEACDEANFLEPNVNANYNDTLDVIIIPPDRIVAYIIAKNMDPRNIRGAELLKTYQRVMSFPNILTHEMVHWDIGGTEFSMDLKRYFQNIGYSFDKSRDGKFSCDGSLKDIEVYERWQQRASQEGSEAKARLFSHYAKIASLGVHDFNEMAAEICAAHIIPSCDGRLKIAGPKRVAQRLIHEAQANPTESMTYVKATIDEAYHTDRNVFELVR